MVSVHVPPTRRAVTRLRLRLFALGLALVTGMAMIGAGLATIGLAESRETRVGTLGLLLIGVVLVLISLVRLRRVTAR
ncbi:hypothetical protein [Herbiconiux sp. YIM B11900]|uniref:hypothetical protein n=1 Tax=Herbiconiux sp. YIM B11900 TaxID=3404131 RepID=UPI003F85373D